MKTSLFRSLKQKRVVNVLTLGLMLLMIFIANSESGVVKAADSSYYISEAYDDISQFRGATKTSPKPTTAGKEEYIFAGWYTNETCTYPMVEDVEGTVYAKFVSPDFMTVRAQIAPNTDLASDKTDMRLVTTVDNLAYDEVGFEIYFNGATVPVRVSSDTVYKRLHVTSDDGIEYGYSPTAFADNATYFTTTKLLNVANKNFSKPFLIKPFWVTLDGTMVYGVNRIARVEDGYSDIVNVPIRLYTDETVNAGSFDVSYDTSILEYVGCDQGNVNAGTVTAVDDTTNSKVAITTTAAATAPNGMVANLRFQIIDGAAMPSNTIFAVSNETVGVDIADVKYDRFSITYSGTPDTSWYDNFKDGTTFAIATPADLYGLAEIVNSGTDNFNGNTIYLAADVVINSGSATSTGWSTASPTPWITIAENSDSRYPSTSFRGTFDGQGNTISGVYMNDANAGDGYRGFFGYVHKNGTVKNFKLTNSYFRAVVPNKDDQVKLGSIAGQMSGDMISVYSNAYVVTEDMAVGGLVGRLQPANDTQKIDDCWFDGKISITSDVSFAVKAGGIGGYAFNVGTTNISNCLNTGEITYTYQGLSTKQVATGGLIGYLADSSKVNGVKGKYKVNVSNCLNTGKLTVQLSTATDGTTTLTAHSSGGVGGFIGYNCNIGDGSGTSYVTITDSITTSSSYSSDYDKSSDSVLCTFTNCASAEQADAYYSDINAHNNAARLGIYTHDESDDTEYWVAREDDIPVLKTFCDEWIDMGWYYHHVDNEEKTSLIIYTPEELYGFSALSQTIDFDDLTVQLGADIKMNSGKAKLWANNSIKPGRLFTPIGKSKSFVGTFEGNGFTVSNIYVNDTSGSAGIGFFAQAGGTIQNFRLEDSYIANNNVSKHNTGSIVGNLRGGSLSKIYSDAIVVNNAGAGSQATGGLVGIYSSTANTISNCWFDGTVTSNGKQTGGIVGFLYNSGKTIENCLNTGKITSTCTNTAEVCTGGIVGLVNASGSASYITNCINLGEVSSKNTSTELEVGSIVGDVKYPVVLSNVYTNNELGGTVAGIGDNADEGTTETTTSIKGRPMVLTDDEVIGNNAYIYTELDFDTIWGAVEGGEPVLRSLYDGEVISEFSGQEISTDWYCNNTVYDETLVDSIGTYTVQDEADFLGLSRIVNGELSLFSGKMVELKEERDFDINPGWEATTKTAAPNKWTPIGSVTATKRFAGTFDGNENIIRGIYLSETENSKGLFGYAGGSSTIKNFTLENSYYDFKGPQGGTVAGICQGNVSDIYVKSNVIIDATKDKIGGIVGDFVANRTRTISNCWFDGTLNTSSTYAGGITGRVYEGTKTIENCLMTGTINSTISKGDAFIGGIVGGAIGTETTSPSLYLTSCVSTGTVNAEYSHGVGSVVGRSVTSSNDTNTDKLDVHVSHVYTTDNRGGLSSYSTDGAISGFGSVSVTYTNMYGEPIIVSEEELAGENVAYYTDMNMWTDSNTSAVWVATDDGPRLKSFSEATVTSFPGEKKVSMEWYCHNVEHLWSRTPTQLNYEIASEDEFWGLARIVNTKVENFEGLNIKLTNDLTMNSSSAADWASGAEEVPTDVWAPIGYWSNGFGGTFDGQNHTISGIYMKYDDTNGAGLFGNTTSTASICNLRLKNSFFTTDREDYIIMGSIVGWGEGLMTNVYSDAIIHSNANQVGGLVGRVQRRGSNEAVMTMTNCWFDGQIVSNSVENGTAKNWARIGGLVGLLWTGDLVIDTSMFTGTIDFTYTNTLLGQTGRGMAIGGFCGHDNYYAETEDGELTYASNSVIIKNSLSDGTINMNWLNCEELVDQYTEENRPLGFDYVTGVVGLANSPYTKTEGGVVSYTDTTETIEPSNTVEKITYVVRTNSPETFNSSTFQAEGIYERDYVLGHRASVFTGFPFARAEGDTTSPIWIAMKDAMPVPEAFLDLVTGESIPVSELIIPDETWYTGDATTYTIDSVEEFYGFARLSRWTDFAGETFQLTGNITINEGDESTWDKTSYELIPWMRIGKDTKGARFAGTFDGQGHTISGIFMEQDVDYLGLFAMTSYGSMVKDFRLVNSYFHQTNTDREQIGCVGSVIGDMRGDMANVYSNATVESSAQQTGGLIARANGFYNDAEGNKIATTVNIDNCWFDGNIITGTNGRYVGGLVSTVVWGTLEMENGLFTGLIHTDFEAYEEEQDGEMVLLKSTYAGGLVGMTMGNPTNLTLKSSISAGKIEGNHTQTSVGSVVGRLCNDVKEDNTTTAYATNPTIIFENVFATKDCYEVAYNKDGNVPGTLIVTEAVEDNPETEEDETVTEVTEEITSILTLTGVAVLTAGDDRLMGYDVLYSTNAWTMRTDTVPVLTCFKDLATENTLIENADAAALAAEVGLDYWNTDAIITDAVSDNAGNYVVTYTADDTHTYAGYFEKLVLLDFIVHTEGATYYKESSEWVINVTYDETASEVTISISTDTSILSTSSEGTES